MKKMTASWNPTPKKRTGFNFTKPLLKMTPVQTVCTPTSKSMILRKLKAAGLPIWGTEAQQRTRLQSLGRIVCFDEDIIETSTKEQLECFLADLGMMPPRNKVHPTKAQLQKVLRAYLEARSKCCSLPATLLKRGKFWRVAIKRRKPKGSFMNPIFVVVSRWGALGRKRNGLQATPMKIVPTPTKNQESERAFKSRDEAMRFARSRIKAKLREGYYLSTEGSLPVQSKENNAPVQVRPMAQRGLKFAGILQVREFDLRKSARKFRDVREDMEVNFESDHEQEA